MVQKALETTPGLISSTGTATYWAMAGAKVARPLWAREFGVGLLSPLSAQVTNSTDVACFGAGDGTATATGIDGTPPYQYSWDTTPPQLSATATNLGPGHYTVTVTDAVNSSATDSVDITEPSVALSASITSQNNVKCFGGATGSATVTASGGTASYSYLWNDTAAQTTATAEIGKAHV